MRSTTGEIVLGYADSPDVVLGSLVERQAGLLRLYLSKPGEVKPLLVQIRNPETGVQNPPMAFEMFELELSIEELLEEDPTQHYAALAASRGGRGAVVDVLGGAGSTIDEADLEE
jgi:hypothetical protein